MPTGYPNLVTIEIPVRVGSRNEVEPEKFRAAMTRAEARDNGRTGGDRTHDSATFAKESSGGRGRLSAGKCRGTACP